MQPASAGDTNLVLSWAGTDNGPGIASYDVYVSTNGGAWGEWLAGTTNVSAVLPSDLANVYSFFSLARDSVGNQQPVPAVSDLTLSVLTVSVSGGLAGPGLRGRQLQTGGERNYTITAIPAFGSAFAGWTGALTNSASSLAFTMRQAWSSKPISLPSRTLRPTAPTTVCFTRPTASRPSNLAWSP